MNVVNTIAKFDRDSISDLQAKRAADRAQADREEPTERLAGAMRQDGTIEPLKELHFNRISSPSEAVIVSLSLLFV
jgi:hypothetical protein